MKIQSIDKELRYLSQESSSNLPMMALQTNKKTILNTQKTEYKEYTELNRNRHRVEGPRHGAEEVRDTV